MLVVFGSINADLMFTLDRLPGPGQTLLANGITIEPGGKGANQAVAAARDGAAVMMAGAVGIDNLAQTALAGLHATGVNVTRVGAADIPTGTAAICIDSAGQNQIVVAPGANLISRAAAVEDALLGPGTIVVTQMECDAAQTAALIRRAHACGARTIHNLAPAGPLDPATLRQVDILVVNQDEAAWLAQNDGAAADDAAALHATLGITIIRNMGSGGVEWAGPGGAGHLPATPIEAIDTTAAGDCFVGVLAAALDRGNTLPDAIKRANAAAALACTRLGSQSSLPTATEIDHALTQIRS